MAPFPEVRLRVRFGRQTDLQERGEHSATFENNRSSASSTSSSAVVTDSYRSTFATTPSNQQNQQTWSCLLANYGPPSTETPTTETTADHHLRILTDPLSGRSFF